MKTIHVVAGIFWCEDRFLIGRRKEGGSFAGKWEFPGGKVREGEEEKDALRREIQEELGAEIEVGEKYAEIEHDYTSIRVKLNFFKAKFFGPPPKTSTSHQALAWVTPKEAKSFDFLEADTPIINKLSS